MTKKGPTGGRPGKKKKKNPNGFPETFSSSKQTFRAIFGHGPKSCSLFGSRPFQFYHLRPPAVSSEARLAGRLLPGGAAHVQRAPASGPRGLQPRASQSFLLRPGVHGATGDRSAYLVVPVP